ncbi:Uma2 family endonuclease [Leptolyngbya sp. 'hensonii']|uniref:Uma2 family endonuclease n=1 Tax=Leptolyngbya sp. 'hensonii' TaxID=1922337 RepID=UPI000ACF842A|nr:Uma2 family endonuclease [Leptolyngbya sp. 'hensonii']
MEAQANYKSEYRAGAIVPMTGGTTNHNQLAGTLYACRGYHVYIGDVRLWIPQHRQYTYPDVMVIQGTPLYTGTSTTTVTNPLLIAEVLSKSTQNYDQGEKFMYYRSISDLREYILIDQARFHVMQYARNAEGKWVLTEYEAAESVLSLSTIEFHIPFRDLYAGVDFSEIEE